MTHVFVIAQAERRTRCTGEALSVSPLCSALPVTSCSTCFQEEMPPLQGGLQPAPWLSVVMSPARTCCLTNTLQWELIISSCDLGGSEGRRGRQRALVSLMERGEQNPQPPARRRGRAAVPRHTGALVPASEGRVTGWHVSHGALLCFCPCEEGEGWGWGRGCSPKEGTLDSLLSS